MREHCVEEGVSEGKEPLHDSPHQILACLLPVLRRHSDVDAREQVVNLSPVVLVDGFDQFENWRQEHLASVTFEFLARGERMNDLLALRVEVSLAPQVLHHLGHHFVVRRFTIIGLGDQSLGELGEGGTPPK